jgi:hypothetical protein
MTAKIIQLNRTRPVKPRSAPDPKDRTFPTTRKAHKAWLGHEGGFVAHTASLLSSDAWRAMSLRARRLIDLLELEHLAHAGTENAHLKLTWRQMREAGIGNDHIAATIAEVETLGLVTVTHKGCFRGAARQSPSTYRLNYLPWKFAPAMASAYYLAPNDEWQAFKGKTVSPKSIRMHLTGRVISHPPGGALPGGSNEVNQGIQDPTNAPPGVVHSLYVPRIYPRPASLAVAITAMPSDVPTPDRIRVPARPSWNWGSAS